MLKSVACAFSAILSLTATVASAADKPEIGPVEAWVQAPPKTPVPMAAAAGAPFADLEQDSQWRFDADGYDFYQNLVLKVQTAQGLQPLSTISLSWSPETDRLVVHRLRILRGDQVIDLLPKDGIFTIARREEKLDSEGRLDGVLTAIVKIDGLQVGDVLEVVSTVHRHDPLFRNRVDIVAGVPDILPAAYVRLRTLWPDATAVRWRTTQGLPEPRVVHHDGLTDAEIVLSDLTPLIKPQGAPARFQRGRDYSVSSYPDWAAVSASMAPLFTTASQLKPNSVLKAEAAAIAAKTQDPKRRAAAALALVQDKIRYLAQTLGEGGYKPVAADDTWERRYGDCKAKTALLLALLHQLGIEAEPVMVGTVLGDDLDTRLPSLAVFNHVLVRAVIDGHDFWLDGTRGGDLSLDRLSIPNFGFVLPLRTSGAKLMFLRPPPFDKPELSNVVRLDASKGLSSPAPAHVEAIFRGESATIMRLAVGNLPPADLDRALRTYWRQSYDYITVKTTSAAFDPATGEETLSMDGEAKMDWSGGFEPDGAVLGWKFDTVRDPAAIHPDAPFTVNYPVYTDQQDTIVLPDHGASFKILGDEVDRQLAGYALFRKASITDGVFRMHASSRALAPEIPYAQAKADAEPVAALSKTTMRVMAPERTSLSDQEAKALLDKTPSDANGFFDRANAFFNGRRYKEALSDLDHAIKLDPQMGKAYGLRALTHVWLGENKAALSDADQGEQIDPREPMIYRARGVVAERSGDWPGAIENFTRSIDLDPSAFGYMHRAEAYRMNKDYPRALRDLDADLKLDPNDPSPHMAKAAIYVATKAPDKARAELAMVKVDAATNERLRWSHASLLSQLSDQAAARAEADAIVRSHPTAANYLQRIELREKDDLKGREADAAAAHAADPKDAAPARYLFAYRFEAKDYAAASAWADQMVALAPKDPYGLIYRGQARVKLGQADKARADFAAARALVKDNDDALNSLCYTEAMVDFDLPQALADCDASLALKRDPNVVDSRGFVLLRLGRNDEALKAFDEALTAKPDLAASLYGRSLVERRLGKTSDADKDRLAALAKAPRIVAQFDGYGVRD